MHSALRRGLKLVYWCVLEAEAGGTRKQGQPGLLAGPYVKKGIKEG